MEYLFGELERIIEEIESTDELDQDEILQILKKYKDEFEEYQLRQEEEKSLEWEDLDN
tara:strand:+ start:285 stop:458 length:174 start_codon:yes stop_codon:yes gene_type:complete